MMLALVFDGSTCIIDVPPFIANDARSYQDKFFEWICDESIDHQYWHYVNGRKIGLAYDVDVFVEWLNSAPLKDYIEVAKVVARDAVDSSEELPSLFF